MKGDVLALVQALSVGQADATLADRYYQEVIDQWGPSFRLSDAALITLSAAAGEFTLPDDFRTLRALIWDETELGHLTLRELESLDPEWRLRKGSPTSWTDEAEPAKTISLYPSPFTKSDPFTGFPPGPPLGSSYPLYSVVAIGSETRQDVPQYFELPLALLILEREYLRESPHKDLELASAWGDVGRLLLSMVS